MKKLDNKAKKTGVMFYNTKNKKAFTLVELIIVVTIIAILGTVAFISFGDYPSQTRDAVRRTDLGNIKKGLELYKIENGDYPLPNNCVEYIDPRSTEEQESTVGCEEKEVEEGKMVGYRYGEIGEDLKEKLKFGGKLEDPLGKKYKYNLSKDGKYYSVEIELETGEKIQEGNISKSCEEIKRNNQFNGSGEYKIYSENFRPIDVFCHENYNETFYGEVIDGTMDNQKTGYLPITGENSDPYWPRIYYTKEGENNILAMKPAIDGGPGNVLEANKYTYVDGKKKYRISGRFKLINNSTNPATLNFGFKEYVDVGGEFKQILPLNVNIRKGTETYLTRKVSKNDKEIYFYCDNGLYNTWNQYIYKLSKVAFDIKDNYEDLPNFNLGGYIGIDSETTLETKNRLSFFPETSECKLSQKNKIGLDYDENTRIRMHYYSDGLQNLRGAYLKTLQNGEWELISGEIKGFSEYGSDWNYFKRGTKVVRLYIYANAFSRQPSSLYPRAKNHRRHRANQDAITYIDDLKLEIISE